VLLDSETNRVLGVHLLGSQLEVVLAAVVEVLELPVEAGPGEPKSQLAQSDVTFAATTLRHLIQKTAG